MNYMDYIKSNKQKILSLASKYGAKNLRVFGSVSRKEETPESDLDLLVELDQDRSLLDRIALMQDLEELLGRKVDVVNEKALHPKLKQTILKEAIPL